MKKYTPRFTKQIKAQKMRRRLVVEKGDYLCTDGETFWAMPAQQFQALFGGRQPSQTSGASSPATPPKKLNKDEQSAAIVFYLAKLGYAVPASEVQRVALPGMSPATAHIRLQELVKNGHVNKTLPPDKVGAHYVLTSKGRLAHKEACARSKA